MKQWEEKLKEHLEGYESTLPDSGLEEFRSKLAAARSTEGASAGAAGCAARAAGHRRAPWLAAFAASAAAVSALLFLPSRNSVNDSTIQVVPQSSVAQNVAQTYEQFEADSLIPDNSLRPWVSTKSTPDSAISVETVDFIEPEVSQSSGIYDSDESNNSSADIPDDNLHEEKINAEPVSVTQPFVDSKYTEKSNSITPKITVATVGTASGVALLAVASNGLFSIADMGTDFEAISYSSSTAPFGTTVSSIDYKSPFRAGLSFRIPLKGRLSLTTGLDYSLYNTKLAYSQSDYITQRAHYLGVPIRLDWSFVQRQVLNAYLGAGFKPDFCIAVSAGELNVHRDGPSLSAVAASGLQININQHIGLYVEPELSWQFFHTRQSLQTYRLRNPLMLSASVGLRYTL